MIEHRRQTCHEYHIFDIHFRKINISAIKNKIINKLIHILYIKWHLNTACIQNFTNNFQSIPLKLPYSRA